MLKALFASVSVGMLLGALPCAAEDVTVLVDVSGTMKNYGSWQSDAVTLIASILDDTARGAGWDREGNDEEARSFKLSSDRKLHFLRFGSIHSPNAPYFAPPLTLRGSAELRQSFPMTPSDFMEAKTNKPLAQAVAAGLSGDKADTFRLIVVSDFMVDAELNPEQRRFVNAFDARVQTEPPIIYSWHSNPHLQVRLITLREKVLPGDAAGSPAATDAAVLRLSGARLFDSPKRVSFGWVLTPDLPEVTYTLTVQNKKSGVVKFSRSRIPALSAIWPNPDSGDYVWKVVAHLPGEQVLASSSAPLRVPGDSVGTALLALAFLGALGGLVWFLSKRRTAARLQASDSGKNTQ